MADGVKVICVGDHIECINGKNIVGTRHYEVARMLKDLPKDQSFKLKLIEPMKAFGKVLSLFFFFFKNMKEQNDHGRRVFLDGCIFYKRIM